MKRGYRILVCVAVLVLFGLLLVLPASAGEATARLDEDTAWLAEQLTAQISEIAAGERASSVIEIDGDALLSQGLRTRWTKEELGVTSIDDLSSIRALFFAQLEDYNRILDALLHDLPYEMYWFDKTLGVQPSFSADQEGVDFDRDGVVDRVDAVTVTGLKFIFAVSVHYCDGDLNTVNTEKAAATSSAISAAREIVETYADLPDYEKLIAYRDAICSLVSYNTVAADPQYTGGYGDPWQLIYVFDKNPLTNVVCEGYAKAFRLLCELSTFDGDVTCYTVTGTMIGATGAGGHMWNIVSMENGASYLVDVTNCDRGTVGEGGGLFLSGYDSEIVNGYELDAGGSTVTYVYDVGTRNLWGVDANSILRLGPTDYEPPAILLSVKSDLVYDGSPLTAGESGTDVIYRASSTLMHTLAWRVEWYRGGTKLSEAPADAGTYTVKVYAESQTAPGVTFEAELTVTVAKALPTYTPPTDLTATYGDDLAGLSLPTGFSWQSGGKVGDAGVQNFFVTFTPTDTVNYETVRNVSVYVTVAKAIPTYPAPERLTVEYGDRVSDLVLLQGFSPAVDATARFLEVGETSVILRFIPTDTKNYQTVENISVPVTVLRRDISDATVTLAASALAYTGGELFPTVESVLLDGLTVTYEISGESAVRAGAYTLTVTGIGNFTGTRTVEWSIVKLGSDSSSQSNVGGADGPSSVTTDQTLTVNTDELPWMLILIVGGGALLLTGVIIIIVSASKRR